jgi:hypothetical protein
VRIRLYRVRKGRGYWEPTARMKAAGFRLTALGPDGPEAWGKAERLNAAWDKARRNDTRADTFESDTLGWLFEQYRHTGVWAAKEPRTREEWELAWRTIGPVFGDLLVAKINFQACDAFYSELRKTSSLHHSHRVFKIFRALLEVAIAFQLISENPSHRIANTAPKGRSAIWFEHEVTALRERAWDMGFQGLSLAIAIAYDTAMAPVDVRLLTLAMQRRQNRDVYFETARAKTERDVIATISPETQAALERYLAGLAFVVPQDQPFIRNRSGHVYSKDTLGDDFRTVRAAIFPGDTRRLMDLRRTANVEAMIGGAEPSQMSAKLSNTLSQSNQIYDTYTPRRLEAVKQADRARKRGKKSLGAGGIARTLKAELENKSRTFPTPAPVSESELPSSAPVGRRGKA